MSSHRGDVPRGEVAPWILDEVEPATLAAEEVVDAVERHVEALRPCRLGLDGHSADRVDRVNCGHVIVVLVGQMDAGTDEPGGLEALAPRRVERLALGAEAEPRGEARRRPRAYGELVAAAATFVDELGAARVLH